MIFSKSESKILFRVSQIEKKMKCMEIEFKSIRKLRFLAEVD